MAQDELRVGIRVQYEAQREAILKMLKDSGFEHVRRLDEDRRNLQDRFKALGGDYKAAMAMAFSSHDFNLIDSMFKASMGVTNQLGAQGGLGRWAEQGGNEVGKLVGRAIGTSPASKAALGMVWGELVELGVKLYGAYEQRRMIGAKMAPVIAAGKGSQTDGFFATGQSYIRRVIEIRQATGESAQAVEGVLTDLSRLGIGFDKVGMEATKYAMAADKVLNLQAGMTKQLEATAIRQYGEEWQDVGSVMQNISGITQYWSSVAERSRSSSAAALASHQTLLEMYKQVQSATKGTSFSMTGLSEMMVATIGTMHKFNIRPGMMAQAAGEFMAAIAPKTSGLHETIQQGFFLRDLLSRSTQGQAILSQANSLAEQQGMDPLFSNLAINQVLTLNKGATAAFGSGVLQGLGRMRDNLPGGSVSDKNAAMMYKMQAFLGTTPLVSNLALRMSDEYMRRLAEPGATPESAMTAVGQSADVRGLADSAGFKGKSMDEILHAMSGMASAQFSTAEKMSMATEALTTRLGDDEYWPKMKERVFEALTGKRPEGESVPMGGAGRSWGPPERPTGIDSEGTSEDVQAADYGMSTPVPKGEVHVASYSMATSEGVRQVDTYAPTSGGASEALLAGIAKVESGGRKDPYSVMGPLTKKGNRAIGKYQVMDFNVPQWTKEALGQSLTPEQYRNSPSAQEAVAKYKLGQYEKKYGIAGAASMWHSGRPTPGNTQDILGTTTKGYVSKVVGNANAYDSQQREAAAMSKMRG
jgi:hypothetical protein